MKQIFACTTALIVGVLMAYFGLGTFINKYFKGRIFDIIIVIILVCLILIVVGVGFNIADHYFNITTNNRK